MGYLRHRASGQDIIGTAEVQMFTQRISDVRALEWGAWEWGSDIRPTESETQTDPLTGDDLLVRQDGELCPLSECELVED